MNAAAKGVLKRASLGPDDRNTLFGIIEEEITRLNKIVTELLRYARPMNVRREDVVLMDVVKQLREAAGEKYPIGNPQIAAEPDVETVWADPNLLRLALQNLVENARQSMPEGGAVVLSAAREKAVGVLGVRIDVTDVGQGMDSRTLHRAMDPFFSTRPSGTGLGLPIAGRIVEAHGGKLDVHSRVGEGTTVTVFIPGKLAGPAFLRSLGSSANHGRDGAPKKRDSPARWLVANGTSSSASIAARTARRRGRVQRAALKKCMRR